MTSTPVFNYWEPLHYLYKGYGFQTWETSPQFAIRSWAYTLLWLLPSKVPYWILRETGKVRPVSKISQKMRSPLRCRDLHFSLCVPSWLRYAQSVKQSCMIPSGSKSTTASLATCCSCWSLVRGCGTHQRVSPFSVPPVFEFTIFE